MICSFSDFHAIGNIRCVAQLAYKIRELAHKILLVFKKFVRTALAII